MADLMPSRYLCVADLVGNQKEPGEDLELAVYISLAEALRDAANSFDAEQAGPGLQNLRRSIDKLQVVLQDLIRLQKGEAMPFDWKLEMQEVDIIGIHSCISKMRVCSRER